MERDYSMVKKDLVEIADSKTTSAFVYDTCVMAVQAIDTLSEENKKIKAENERLSKSADAYKEAAVIFQSKAYEEQKQREALEVENQQLKKERDAYKAAAESAAETELGKSLIKMTLLWSRAETEAQQLRGRKEIVEVEKNRAKYEEGWPDFFSGNLAFHESAKPIVSVMENYTGGDDVMAHTARMVDAMTAINDAVRVESAAVCAPDRAAKAENSANQAAKATTGEGVKGLLVLRCKSCGNLFATFLKERRVGFACRCGKEIPLENLARFSWTCSCGRCNYGRTNTTDAEITAGVIRCVCGEKSPEMVWSYERREYLEVSK